MFGLRLSRALQVLAGQVSVRIRGDQPTRTLKEAGLRLSREESSFRGVRHFWQCSLDMVGYGDEYS